MIDPAPQSPYLEGNYAPIHADIAADRLKVIPRRVPTGHHAWRVPAAETMAE